MTFKYNDLLLAPPPSKDEIMAAIKKATWQELRTNLKGVPTEAKLKALRAFLKAHPQRWAEVVVHNYINALKRGGQLK